MTIRIVELRLSGPKVEDAILKLEPGPNVLSGTSDTGKSYVLKLLDFALGADELGKQVDEAQGYDLLRLELQNDAEESIVLQRSLSGGRVRVWRASLQEVRAADKDGSEIEYADVPPRRSGQAKVRDLTTEVFMLAGIASEVTIRRNARGQTQRMSLRMLSPLLLVDETSIIAEEALLTTGPAGVVERTARQRLVSFLLTNVDDSNVVPATGSAVAHERVQAKMAIINDLLTPLEERLSQRAKEDDDASVNRLEQTIKRLSDAIAETDEFRTYLQDQIDRLEARRRKATSQIVAVDQLISRYTLLAERYESDLTRLDFIAEGSHFLAALQVSGCCPLCGQPLVGSHTHEESASQPLDPSLVHQAAQVEASKIRGLMRDLRAAIKDATDRKDEWTRKRRGIENELRTASHELRHVIEPAAAQTSASLEDLVAKRVDLEGVAKDRQERERLLALREQLEETRSNNVATEWAGIDSVAAWEFCKEIEHVLRSWSWPDDVHVEFQERDYDIKVDGRLRRSRGKGYRAVLNAAVMIGLARYCALRQLPHLGFLVIDSPLTTIKEEIDRWEILHDEDSELPPKANIEACFWESLPELVDGFQLLVIDNKEPPPEFAKRLNLQIFAGPSGKHGERKGFIPQKVTSYK